MNSWLICEQNNLKNKLNVTTHRVTMHAKENSIIVKYIYIFKYTCLSAYCKDFITQCLTHFKVEWTGVKKFNREVSITRVNMRAFNFLLCNWIIPIVN